MHSKCDELIFSSTDKTEQQQMGGVLGHYSVDVEFNNSWDILIDWMLKEKLKDLIRVLEMEFVTLISIEIAKLIHCTH